MKKKTPSIPLFRLALVTGASSGIGEEICRLLASQGVHLIITGRQSSALHQLADECRSLVNVSAYPCDLSIKEERQLIIEKIHDLSPDLVINNAGFGLYGEALTYSTEEQLKILPVNIEAVVEISLEAARTMISHRHKGVILNVSSAAAFQPFPFFSVYAASKSFVNEFSESFDAEVSPYGVRVLAACPGQVATKFRERASQRQSTQTPSDKAMSASFAARQIWKQIRSRRPLHVFDWKYRAATFLTRYLIPKGLIKKILRFGMEKRIPKRHLIKIREEENP